MDDELKKRIDYLEKRVKKIENYLSAFSPSVPVELASDDDFYDDAVKIAIEYGTVSSSLFQRRLQIGFNRAARLVEILTEKGIVEDGYGSKPRKVLVGKDYLKKP